jgi:AcrR family transcriptional regulator
MPKTWSDTLEGHREAVRFAVMEAATALASEGGFHKVSMSDVAARAGITRATLYKYFADVEAIFEESHQRILERHLRHVQAMAEGDGDPLSRLTAIARFFADMSFRHHGHRSAEVLHRKEHARAAEERLLGLVERILAEGSEAGLFRRDVPPRELAVYLHGSLAGAHRLPHEEAVRRLVSLLLESIATR